MVHRCRLTAEAELSLYLTAGGRESGLAMMFTDKIEDLLLPASQGFHTVQENTLQRRRAGSNGVLEQWSGGELENWNIGVLEYWSIGLRWWRRTMAGRNPNEAVSFSAHYSITPSLHHSITPSLHHSITPSLHHSITPLLPHSTAPALHTPLLHLTYAVASYIRCGRHDRHRRILDSR